MIRFTFLAVPPRFALSTLVNITTYNYKKYSNNNITEKYNPPINDILHINSGRKNTIYMSYMYTFIITFIIINIYLN